MVRSTQSDYIRRRFSRDDYYRTADAGILTAELRVELLDGEIVEIRPIGAQHRAAVRVLNEFFSVHVGKRAIVDVQNPLTLDD